MSAAFGSHAHGFGGVAANDNAEIHGRPSSLSRFMDAQRTFAIAGHPIGISASVYDSNGHDDLMGKKVLCDFNHRRNLIELRDIGTTMLLGFTDAVCLYQVTVSPFKGKPVIRGTLCARPATRPAVPLLRATEGFIVPSGGLITAAEFVWLEDAGVFAEGVR